MGPFCPEQGTSFHETLIDLASTDERVILLTDEVGAMETYENIINMNIKMYYYSLPDESVVLLLIEILRRLTSLPYTPLRSTIQKVPGLIPVNVNGDDIGQ